MALWSVTWCAKWRALSAAPPRAHDDDGNRGGEDWSSALSEDALVAHVRERVEHYLSRQALASVWGEAAG
jgi:hypothetical protein